MSDEAPAPKKKGKLKSILLATVSLGVVGAGSAAGALYFLGGTHAAGAEPAAELERPQLAPRGEVSDATVERAVAQAARTGRADPRVFQATYVPMEDNFTSNLSGGGSFVQIGIAMLTYYDEGVVSNIERHELAIRSAVLMTLAQTDPVEVGTPEGKDRLREALKRAINETLEAREGFGGVDSVHFTSFVTQ